MPKKLDFRTVQTHLRLHGITIRKTEYGEYRVNFTNGKEATAAYETDLKAAYGTGLAMAKERK